MHLIDLGSYLGPRKIIFSLEDDQIPKPIQNIDKQKRKWSWM